MPVSLSSLIENTFMKAGSRVGLLCVRSFWAFAGLMSTTAVGAVTMRTVVAFDKNVCAAFRKMVVAADVAHMTDKQLCDFRFSRLPTSKTTGFTFPQWNELSVSDPVETFRKISWGNMRGGRETLGYPRPDILESISINNKENNLKFYTTQVQIAGKGQETTFLSVDIVSCPVGKFNDEFGAPALFAFNAKGLTEQEPIEPSSLVFGGAQVALWKDNIPVLLSIFSYWSRVAHLPGATIVVSLNGWYRRKDGEDPEYIYAYPVCTLRINKK